MRNCIDIHDRFIRGTCTFIFVLRTDRDDEAFFGRRLLYSTIFLFFSSHSMHRFPFLAAMGLARGCCHLLQYHTQQELQLGRILFRYMIAVRVSQKANILVFSSYEWPYFISVHSSRSFHFWSVQFALVNTAPDIQLCDTSP